jgi:hypothetical protein
MQSSGARVKACAVPDDFSDGAGELEPHPMATTTAARPDSKRTTDDLMASPLGRRMPLTATRAAILCLSQSPYHRLQATLPFVR